MIESFRIERVRRIPSTHRSSAGSAIVPEHMIQNGKIGVLNCKYLQNLGSNQKVSNSEIVTPETLPVCEILARSKKEKTFWALQKNSPRAEGWESTPAANCFRGKISKAEIFKNEST